MLAGQPLKTPMIVIFVTVLAVNATLAALAAVHRDGTRHLAQGDVL
jgi:hypothetical protein